MENIQYITNDNKIIKIPEDVVFDKQGLYQFDQTIDYRFYRINSGYYKMINKYQYTVLMGFYRKSDDQVIISKVSFPIESDKLIPASSSDLGFPLSRYNLFGSSKR